MASITVLDKGVKNKERFKVTYEIRSLDNRRRRRSKTFPNGTGIREVERFKRKVEMQYEEGEVVDHSKRLFEDFAQEYFENYTFSLSPTTLLNYKRMYENNRHGLRVVFGKMQLAKIQPAIIQRYVNNMLKEQISPKTIRNYIQLLHAMFQRAMRLRYISRDFNPAEEVDLPKIKKEKVEAYTEEELQTLIKLLDNSGDTFLSECIKTIIGTGIRRSELCGLKFENFSSEEKEISITESIVYNGKENVVKSPKTEAGNRTISLPDTVIEIFEERQREYLCNKLKMGKNFKDSGYIFSNSDGSALSPMALSKRYQQFMQKHTSEIRYLSLHKLRHTFASIAIANHCDIKALQETLGHKDAMTTLNTYSHGYKKAKENYANLIENNIFKKEVPNSCHNNSPFVGRCS